MDWDTRVHPNSMILGSSFNQEYWGFEMFVSLGVRPLPFLFDPPGVDFCYLKVPKAKSSHNLTFKSNKFFGKMN
jgi:hypothetical protein